MATTELQPDESGAKPAPSQPNKSRRAFSALKRELTDKELGSPGAHKLLIEELERLSEENTALLTYRDKFYTADKDLAVVHARLNRHLSVELLSTGCLAIGAAALGYAPAVWSSQPSGWIAIAFGSVLMVVGLLAKAIKA